MAYIKIIADDKEIFVDFKNCNLKFLIDMVSHAFIKFSEGNLDIPELDSKINISEKYPLIGLRSDIDREISLYFRFYKTFQEELNDDIVEKLVHLFLLKYVGTDDKSIFYNGLKQFIEKEFLESGSDISKYDECCRKGLIKFLESLNNAGN